jgi:hypothetical protein
MVAVNGAERPEMQKIERAGDENETQVPGACGQPARFGCGEEGRWFCAAHRPEAGRA